MLDEKLKDDIFLLGQKMRQKGYRIENGLSVVKMSRALEYADKNKIGQVIILGEDEKKKGIYKIKNMISGKETINKI